MGHFHRKPFALHTLKKGLTRDVLGKRLANKEIPQKQIMTRAAFIIFTRLLQLTNISHDNRILDVTSHPIIEVNPSSYKPSNFLSVAICNLELGNFCLTFRPKVDEFKSLKIVALSSDFHNFC